MADPNPKRTITVTVSVDPTTHNPVFTFSDPQLPVDDKERVVWILAQSSQSQFEFAALAFHKRNPFSGVVIHKDVISALDYYEAKKDPLDFSDHQYSILVKDITNKAIHTYYNSHDWGPYPTDTGGPTIRNK